MVPSHSPRGPGSSHPNRGVWRLTLRCCQVSFVVMGNVFPYDVPLHRKYDLKGSTYGRTAGKKLSSPGAMLKASMWVSCKLMSCPCTPGGCSPLSCNVQTVAGVAVQLLLA